MKRILFMVAVVAMIAGLAIGASAADYTPNDNGIYSVEYQNDSIVDGAQYGFVVIEGIENAVLDLSEENLSKVLYIDQTAAADGAVSFDAVGLKGVLPSDDAFVGGTGFIGGEGFETAQEIGKFLAASEGPVVVPVESVEISGDTEVEVGKTITLSATVTPDNATNATVTWSSTANANVDQNGVVTGVAEGTATITATADGKSDTYEITVKAAGTEEPEGILGDVNGDKAKNANDAVFLLRHISLPAFYPTSYAGTKDFDRDGSLTSADAVYLLRHISLPAFYPIAW